MEQKRRLTKNKDEIDFAYLNRPHIAIKYVDFIKQNTDIKVIYYGHDLHFLREYREYELTGDIKKKRESDYWKSIEFSLMEKAAVRKEQSQRKRSHGLPSHLRLSGQFPDLQGYFLHCKTRSDHWHHGSGGVRKIYTGKEFSLRISV